MCREVFQDVPVFLCAFHVIQAWIKHINSKLRNKSRKEEAFDSLHDILYLRAVGSEQDHAEAIQAAIMKFEAFQAESPLVAYFSRTLDAKWSMFQSQI
jgi:hypothetical protein